jgi:hypothetical protein
VIDAEHVHVECASPGELEDISLKEILSSHDLEELAVVGKSCFCDRCGKRIIA